MIKDLNLLIKAFIKLLINRYRGIYYRYNKVSLLEKQYKEKCGYPCNLENPVTLSEKKQWLKLYYHHPDMRTCTDKYLVRAYIASLGLSDILVPLLGVYNHFWEIPFEQMPSSFVVKMNHGSNMNYFVKHKSHINRLLVSLIFEIYKRIKFEYYNVESHYAGIQPKLIVEPFLLNIDRKPLVDYRIICYAGNVEFITPQIYTENFRNEDSQYVYFDQEFNRTDMNYHLDQNPDTLIPKHRDRMIEIAKLLSKPFPSVRVDFYEVNDQLYFSELTFTANGGYSSMNSREKDVERGKLLILPK